MIAVASNRSSFAEKRIVVCEDDLGMLDSISDMLTDLGAVVSRFTDANFALESISSEKPDVVVSDISMPEMTGLDFLQELNNRNIKVPMIFLTGNADIDTYRRGLVRGQFEFLTKPLVPDALLNAIQKALVFSETTKAASLETSKVIAKLSGIDRSGEPTAGQKKSEKN